MLARVCAQFMRACIQGKIVSHMHCVLCNKADDGCDQVAALA